MGANWTESWRDSIHRMYGMGSGGRKDVFGGGDPTAGFKNKDIQSFLPPSLRWWTGKGKNKELSPFAQGLGAGTENLAELFSNPGGFAGNISSAIAPRVAMEQEAIGRGTAGGMAEAAGRASRSGTAGTGIAQALQAAIQQSGEREKAGSVRQAQVDSAQLRRQDLATMLQTYQMLMDWTNAGRQALSGDRQDRLGFQGSQRAGQGQAFDQIGQVVGAVGGGMGGA